ncbi:EpsG family protein [Alcanivorax jadensis]|uniref:EpsG family protein n=1 Tax=Alcanivorax jadensis TaxID=64988 RepID=UPI002408F502|nr:EpsG family protein [Alcanivorax jadensis]MDF1639180.1 EpsG family protein [Alcanivorax jadensis]
MLPYWFLLALPVALAFLSGRLSRGADAGVWGIVWLFIALMIGLRHSVGGDWESYIYMLSLQPYKSFGDVVSGGDPGYFLINWLVAHFGGSIYWVNTLCGMIMMAGVVRFARTLPLPWLALLVAVPYLIIVVGMGYTRQSAALGFLLLGLVSLGQGSIRAFAFWVVLGAAFHKSAVLMLPVAALASTSNRFWTWIWGGVFSLAAAYFFLFDSVDHLWLHYVESDHYQSQGGLIRVVMNAVPALLFLLLHRKFVLSEAERKLWGWMSVLSLVCVPLVMISSTATDRVALYLIPIQMFVFAWLPFISEVARGRALIVLGIVSYYIAVQFVWLFFGGHAFAWLPYRTVFSL